MKKSLIALFSFALAAMLVGCGGGGSAEVAASGGSVQVASTGKFIDSAVSGLAYSSKSTTGVTGPGGEFDYVAGETVTFSIGGIVLGTARGAAVMTPTQLAGSGASATNMLRVLQTLDDDNDPSNGVQLTSSVVLAAKGMRLDFDALPSDFDAQSTTQHALSVLTPLTQSGTKPLVASDAAQDHFRASMASLFDGTFSVAFDSGTTATLAVASKQVTGYTGTAPDGRGIASAEGFSPEGKLSLYCQVGGAAEPVACFQMTVTDTNGVTTKGSWSASNGATSGVWSAVRKTPAPTTPSRGCAQLLAVNC